MTPEQDAGEKPERMRLICQKCHAWIETISEGLRHLHMQGCDVLPPPSQEAVKAARATAAFMKKHMSHSGCGAFIDAFYESDQKWAALDLLLDGAKREDEGAAD